MSESVDFIELFQVRGIEAGFCEHGNELCSLCYYVGIKVYLTV